MAEFIVMPKMGFDMREGVFNQWLKAVGDAITRGEVVAEIESDKATLDLESQTAGVLLATLVNPGDVVAVGANVAIVGEKGEDISGMAGGGESKPAPAAEAPKKEEAPSTQPETAKAATTNVTAEANAEFPAGVKATPVARRVAKEEGVDLLAVPFEGERIRKADVAAFVAGGGKTPEAPQSSVPSPQSPTPVVISTPTAPVQSPPTPITLRDGDETLPASKLRQAIARRMTESKTTVPHFQVTMEIDMEPAMALRQQVNEMLAADGIKVSVNDLLVKAAGLALTYYPNLNASFGGDKIVRRKAINVGSAVATPNGLLTVVQKNTDKSTLSQIARDNKEMVERARSGKIHPDDVSDGTFTLSNLGVYGVDAFTAIINPPEAAILAIGGIIEKPVVKNGQIVIGHTMKVTISADHRVTDGAEAAEFMVKFKAILENPMRLLA
ncbi:MAG: dihydrolipoamide acetyltransferase family protein [Chloroflexi bacterium]|nr:dihydrolipoamide acetyltransferase family protein [Chloroflexota bacterium]